MPYKSKMQKIWAHSSAGKKALGAKKVAEWDKASKGKKLPTSVKKTGTKREKIILRKKIARGISKKK